MLMAHPELERLFLLRQECIAEIGEIDERIEAHIHDPVDEVAIEGLKLVVDNGQPELPPGAA